MLSGQYFTELAPQPDQFYFKVGQASCSQVTGQAWRAMVLPLSSIEEHTLIPT